MSSPQLSGVDFLHKGYRYWLARQGEENVFWYCCKRPEGCPARLFTSLKRDTVAEQTDYHDHPPTESISTNGIVPSTKGSSGTPALTKSGLRHNGYDFHQERLSENGTKAYWACKQKRSMQCAARVHTLTESKEVVHEFGEHNHPPVDGDETTTASPEPEPTSEHDVCDSPVASPKSSAHARSGLHHKGFTYGHHSSSRDGTKRLFHCKERRGKQCTVRVNATASGKVVQVVGQHNHPPSGPVKPSTKEMSRKPAKNSSTSESRLQYKNAVYQRDQLSKDGTKRYWYCKHKRITHCPSRIHTSVASGEVVQQVGKHNHRPSKTEGNAASKEEVFGKSATIASPAQSTIRHKWYDYHREKETVDGTTVYWYCKDKHSKQCSARIHTSAAGKVVKEVGEHSHPPTYAVAKKESCNAHEDTPKTSHSAKRRTLSANREQSPKKRRTSVAVDTKKNSTPSNTTASPVDSTSTPSTFALVQRLMGLPLAKRTSAAVLFNSLLDEMEGDVKKEH